MSVERADRLDRDPPTLIGGTDIEFEQEGEATRAMMVLLTWSELELAECQVVRAVTTVPYIPGFLSLCETLALLAAREQFSQKPGLLFTDSHGVSYLRRLGAVSHPGLMIDVPTIGVAKKRLRGEIGKLGDEPDTLALLMDKNEQLTRVQRSKVCCNPPFINTGHRVGMDSALMWVERYMRGCRPPGPVCRADAVVSRRPSSVRWQADHG